MSCDVLALPAIGYGVMGVNVDAKGTRLNAVDDDVD